MAAIPEKDFGVLGATRAERMAPGLVTLKTEIDTFCFVLIVVFGVNAAMSLQFPADVRRVHSAGRPKEEEDSHCPAATKLLFG